MKKSMIVALLMATALSAGAAEVGIYGGRDFAGTDAGTVRGVVSTALPAGLTGNLELTRERKGSTGINQVGLTLQKSLYTLGPVSLSGKTGVALVDRVGGTGQNGYALTAGLVGSVPVTKSTTFETGIERRIGQSRVSDVNGNTFLVGVKTSF